MSLVELITPDSESDLVTTVALLDARGIPYYVRDAGFGSLYPGPEVSGLNSRTIFVPEEALADARALLDSNSATGTGEVGALRTS